MQSIGHGINAPLIQISRSFLGLSYVPKSPTSLSWVEFVKYGKGYGQSHYKLSESENFFSTLQ
jgi:hypothetical protein